MDEQSTASGIPAEVSVGGDGDEEVEVVGVGSTAAGSIKGGGRRGVVALMAPAAYLWWLGTKEMGRSGGDDEEHGEVAVMGVLGLRC